MRPLLIIFFSFISLNAFPKTQKLIGKAYNKDGKLLYIEKHEYQYDLKAISSDVKYFRPDSKSAFAELSVDFSPSQTLPNSKFIVHRTGKMDEISWVIDAKKVKVIAKNNKDSELLGREFKVESDLISAHGINHFIIAHFDQLSTVDGSKEFKLIVPPRQVAYDFKIKSSAINEKELVLTVNISNWLMRLFAPSIKLIYEKTSKRFIRFEGSSNLAAEDGIGQDVIVEFTYL